MEKTAWQRRSRATAGLPSSINCTSRTAQRTTWTDLARTSRRQSSETNKWCEQPKDLLGTSPHHQPVVADVPVGKVESVALVGPRTAIADVAEGHETGDEAEAEATATTAETEVHDAAKSLRPRTRPH